VNGVAADAPLADRRIVTTRRRPGRLDRLLSELGATVVHMPLIEIGDPPDGGAALAAALARIEQFDWVVVTSSHGAERIAPALRGTRVRTAAVGTATAETLAAGSGRAVDLVPATQQAAALVDAFPPGAWTVLAAQADRAERTLVDGLRARGNRVEECVAYSTQLRRPPTAEVEQALACDAVAFASGSAARAWADAIGARTPPVVAVIGPTTDATARASGLTVTATASDHSVTGLAELLRDLLAP
jgi:uroporphyrinogen-III synthase